MHYSYANNASLALTAYWDDSGSDDLSPVTTIGGPVMSKEAFTEFSDKWNLLLLRHRIPSPFHMTDFVGPEGKHAGKYKELKKALFLEAVELIKAFRLFSVSVSVKRDDFDSVLSKEIRRKLIGPYGIAFYAAVKCAQAVSSVSTFFAAQEIAFIIDTGFGGSDQLKSCHAAIIDSYRAKGLACFCGPLDFVPDDNVPALQAADIVAWAARKSESNALSDEYVPFQDLLNGRHSHVALPKDAVHMFAAPINNWLTRRQKMPSLADILK